ncbi:MAG: circadian clock KaiB family protein [Bacteroidota bacterium]|nr:circadian clock KaiB family protein [Bacteroidota bacterium]
MTKQDISSSDSWQNSDTEQVFSLKLFVTGASPNSARAIANLKNICEKYLSTKYDLEIIDIYQQPLLAQNEHIIALPMLVKSFPLPLKRLVGDMSNTEKVLRGLGLNT